MQQIGRYLIKDELGRGAMGVVFRAEDPAIGRLVAIKTIRLHEITDPQERERLQSRLLREARSAGILNHPGIVTVYDVGEQDNLAYFAMEFVSGTTLEKVLAAPEPPAPQTILQVIRQTAAALDYAHKRGIVHRDIKPANIMIDEEGVVKITDFGVAKLSASAQLTQAGTMLGTPNYMSPEQVQGKDVSGQADQFSLGIISYEMLTGEKPFTSEQVHTILFRIISEDPVPPSRLNPSLPPEADLVIGRALAKEPAQRYGSCTEFAEALDAALARSPEWKPLMRGVSLSMPTIVERTGAAPPAPPDTAAREQAAVALPPVPRSGGSAAFERPRPKLWPYVLAVLVVFAGLGIFLFTDLSIDDVMVAAGLSEPAPEDTGAQPSPGEAAETPPPPAATGLPDSSAGAAEPEASPPEPQPETGMAAAPVEAKPEPKPPPSRSAREPAPPVTRTVRFETQPPGARVIVDGNPELACSAPCEFPLEPGVHTASAILDGYLNGFERFTVGDSSLRVRLVLGQRRGRVEISTDPPGADIFVDGNLQDVQTPASLQLPVGQHTLIVTKEGFQRLEETFEVREGAVAFLKYTLARRPNQP